MANHDHIKIEILADGTIKVTTDPISGPNHVNAEGFLRQMANLAGGESIRSKRTETKHHHHDQDHTHEHGEEHEHTH